MVVKPERILFQRLHRAFCDPCELSCRAKSRGPELEAFVVISHIIDKCTTIVQVNDSIHKINLNLTLNVPKDIKHDALQ